MVEEPCPLQSSTGILKKAEQTEKSFEIALPQFIAHVFWSFPNHLIDHGVEGHVLENSLLG